jgi:hypothetical protein
MFAISRVERRKRIILKRKLFPPEYDDVTGAELPNPAEDDGGRMECEP